jgi:hypothetical protein
MHIVYVFADTAREWNCSEWRCAVPARAINTTRRHTASLLSLLDFAHNTSAAQTACRPADVIVVQRNLVGPVLSAMQHWKARGKTVLADFDDAYDLMPPSNPGYRFWHQHLATDPDGQEVRIAPPPLTQFKWGLRLAHAATVPSKRLADDWREYAQVEYVPNYIELDNYLLARREPHEGVILGWGGSLSHLQSFTGSGLLAALKRVCRARPQVKVMICGGDRRIFDQLPLPPAQKILMPWTKYADWPRQMAAFDIGLAPLHGAYDERRSWIKVLEYMVMKIPWVASEGPAYHDLRRMGWLVRNTPNAWERILLDMVDHLADYADEAGREAHLFGLSQSSAANAESLVATYEQVIERTSDGWVYPEPGLAGPVPT